MSQFSRQVQKNHIKSSKKLPPPHRSPVQSHLRPIRHRRHPLLLPRRPQRHSHPAARLPRPRPPRLHHPRRTQKIIAASNSSNNNITPSNTTLQGGETLSQPQYVCVSPRVPHCTRPRSIRALALSTADVSSDARYILVVASLSCPIPSLITPTGTPLALAADAQLWRAT